MSFSTVPPNSRHCVPRRGFAARGSEDAASPPATSSSSSSSSRSLVEARSSSVRSPDARAGGPAEVNLLAASFDTHLRGEVPRGARPRGPTARACPADLAPPRRRASAGRDEHGRAQPARGVRVGSRPERGHRAAVPRPVRPETVSTSWAATARISSSSGRPPTSRDRGGKHRSVRRRNSKEDRVAAALPRIFLAPPGSEGTSRVREKGGGDGRPGSRRWRATSGRCTSCRRVRTRTRVRNTVAIARHAPNPEHSRCFIRWDARSNTASPGRTPSARPRSLAPPPRRRSFAPFSLTSTSSVSGGGA